MALKPLIGVNADYRSARKDAPAVSYLFSGYYDSLVKTGAIPMVIPPLKEEDDLSRVLDTLDAVVLVGGADLDPRLDGYMLHPSLRLLDRRREEFDRMLVRMLAERRMPVLGIGCGMQLLNVSQGGNLFLHIAEDLPRALPHADVTEHGSFEVWGLPVVLPPHAPSAKVIESARVSPLTPRGAFMWVTPFGNNRGGHALAHAPVHVALPARSTV